MTEIHYHIVEHDGGWAYKLGEVFSETFRTREDAHMAAEIAAREQHRGGEDVVIFYDQQSHRYQDARFRVSPRCQPRALR